jgi:hypothetical protein
VNRAGSTRKGEGRLQPKKRPHTKFNTISSRTLTDSSAVVNPHREGVSGAHNLC